MKQTQEQMFTVIGGGYVYIKYFAPLHKLHKIFIKRVIDIVDPKLPKTDFQRTNGSSADTINQIKKNASKNEAIMILTPPHTHLKILRALLVNTEKKIYLEKPAVTSLTDLRSIEILLKRYKNRIYFPEQYSYGRAPIFIKAFSKSQARLGKIKRINLFLEEGSKYFQDFQKWRFETDINGREYFSSTRSWFADVGPELDLGIHLLGILFSLFPAATYQIVDVTNADGYLQNYGVDAQINFVIPNSESFPVSLRCGKKLGRNRRYFEIVCENGKIWQEFTSGSAKDPVYIDFGRKPALVDSYMPNRKYFEIQILNFISWLNQPFSQGFVIKALRCALEIKQKRLLIHEPKAQKGFNLIAMIPARLNDYRIEKKNIRHMAGKPLIYYSIKAAQDAGVFDRIYVNSESNLIGMIGKKLGVDFYKRMPELATDKVTNEQFVFDFLQNVKTKYLFMINPNKPLVKPREISLFVKSMIRKKLDVMFSTEAIHTQVFYKGVPINFSLNKPNLRSKQINPVQAIQWTITGWKAKTFLKSYSKKGYAVYSGKIGLFPVSDDANFSVKQERDFCLAEKMLKINSPTRKNP